MYVRTDIQLDPGDVFDLTVNDAAAAILAALNADPAKDSAQVTVHAPTGLAGAVTIPPETPPDSLP